MTLTLLICATFLALREQVATIATAIGALLSLAYFLQKQKLEEMRLFRDIFKECNARYDAMNESLTTIAERPTGSLNSQEMAQVIDYLNLCGEEFLYFKRGYVEPSVWQAWHNGMKAIVATPNIRSVWEREKKTSSYYDLPL